MFTIEQIKSAHARSKTGADFPGYIADIKKLGVLSYKTIIANGHTEYMGANGYKQQTEGLYPAIEVAAKADPAQFENDLKTHQHGGSDFTTFCRQAAASGVEGWVVDLEKYTCTYFGLQGGVILVEAIPQVES